MRLLRSSPVAAAVAAAKPGPRRPSPPGWGPSSCTGHAGACISVRAPRASRAACCTNPHAVLGHAGRMARPVASTRKTSGGTCAIAGQITSAGTGSEGRASAAIKGPRSPVSVRGAGGTGTDGTAVGLGERLDGSAGEPSAGGGPGSGALRLTTGWHTTTETGSKPAGTAPASVSGVASQSGTLARIVAGGGGAGRVAGDEQPTTTAIPTAARTTWAESAVRVTVQECANLCHLEDRPIRW
jgi:hypothetical protein